MLRGIGKWDGATLRAFAGPGGSFMSTVFELGADASRARAHKLTCGIIKYYRRRAPAGVRPRTHQCTQLRATGTCMAH
jgi:hypothetical protein